MPASGRLHLELIPRIASVFSAFTDPAKRVFAGYLAVSVLIALVWLVLVCKTPLCRAWGRVFDRSVFFSASSLADCKIFVINRVFTFVISPLLLSQAVIGTTIYCFLHGQDFLHSGMFAGARTGWLSSSLW